MTTLDRSATLDPRALKAAADGVEGFTVPGVPAHVVASAAITAYLAAPQPHASEACPHCGGGPWRRVRDLPNGSVIVQCRECKAATNLKEWGA